MSTSSTRRPATASEAAKLAATVVRPSSGFGLVIRIERGVVDLEKDRLKGRQVAQFGDRLQGMIEQVTPTVSAQKRTAVEDFYWLIEEYKVSVFAQELRTAMPVSAKRLERRAAEIERMA